MCQIAAYTGPRRAAPILIDMIRRQEFIDGGCSTGIATIHEGKIYLRKVVGDVETLLRETDALDLPGTVGILHSRPYGSYPELAHPFISPDGTTAVCNNGTMEQSGSPEYVAHACERMAKYFNRGDRVTTERPETPDGFLLPNGHSFHVTETYSYRIADLVQGGLSVSEAMLEALDDLPRDVVALAINLTEPDAVTVGRITRPASVAVGNGETFLSSTPLGFPEDCGPLTIFPVPPASVGKLRPGSYSVEPYPFRNVRIEPISAKAWAIGYQNIEAALRKATKETALCFDDLEFWRDYWPDMWEEPAIDCRYSTGKGWLKPYPELFYAVLYSLHRQGRLRDTIGRTADGKNPVRRFWVED